MELAQILKTYFGHTEYREGQKELIDRLLASRDVVGVMPTGAGKSLCYQAAAMALPGITLVISPLISLMMDQVQALIQSGVPAAYLNSSLTPGQYTEALRRAARMRYKIIYIAPERLQTEEFFAFAKLADISLVAVDEAHCVSQWGQDFRPSYIRIADFLSELSKRPVVGAFTATATERVREDIVRLLRLEDPFVLTTGFDRQNLYFAVQKPESKLSALMNLVSAYKDKSGIVYCATRKAVEEVTAALIKGGAGATRYHAGLTPAERQKNQEDFLYDRKPLMVATNAFGMGIDKSNVSFVVHYNMPKNIESYYQEAGRAGRDGEPADCVLFYAGKDVRLQDFLIDKSLEENEELSDEEKAALEAIDKELLKQMVFYCTTTQCLRAFILRYFGEKAPRSCGHCLNCDTQFELTDVTKEAQAALSLMVSLQKRGRRFGRSMLADVLRGSKSERLIRLGLDRERTYGVLSEKSATRVRSVLDHLVEAGYAGATEDAYPVVFPQPCALDVLTGDEAVSMQLVKEQTAKKERLNPHALRPVNSSLLEELKALRKRLAQREGVPAYIVCTDATLSDMCLKLPRSLNEFLLVSGIGQAKMERYGEAFIEVIEAFGE